MNRETLSLLGLGLAVLALLALFLFILDNLVGFVVLLTISLALGFASNAVFPNGYAHGRLGATLVGLFGATVAHLLLGKWGPAIYGVHILPAFGGAAALSYVLRNRQQAERVQQIENLTAPSNSTSTDPYLKSRLGQYRVVQFLGAGAFARVYKVLPDADLNPEGVKAVKIFSADAVDSKDFMGRFEREVALSKGLNHPNIVKIFDAHQDDGVHYLLMEFVDGPNLTQKLKEQVRLEIPEVLRWSLALARALAHAHSKGVIHRDIKPDNVLLGVEGPKLTDFGLARLEGVNSSLTQSGSAIGTPHYMSPEQAVEEKTIDGRADQYALGCMMYELLTAEKVFDGEQAVQVIMKHIQEEPRDPRLLRMDIPERLSQTILRMLSKKREERFPTMDPIVDRLAWLLAHWDEMPKQPKGPALATS